MGGYEQWLLDQLIAGRSPTNNGYTREDLVWLILCAPGWLYYGRLEFGDLSLSLKVWILSLEFAAWKLKSNHVESTNATAIKTNGGCLRIWPTNQYPTMATWRSARQKRGLDKTHVTYPSWTWSFTRWRLGKVPDDPWIQLRDVESVFSIEDRLCWYDYLEV